jgi:hypothetical protein
MTRREYRQRYGRLPQIAGGTRRQLPRERVAFASWRAGLLIRSVVHHQLHHHLYRAPLSRAERVERLALALSYLHECHQLRGLAVGALP